MYCVCTVYAVCTVCTYCTYVHTVCTVCSVYAVCTVCTYIRTVHMYILYVLYVLCVLYIRMYCVCLYTVINCNSNYIRSPSLDQCSFQEHNYSALINYDQSNTSPEHMSKRQTWVIGQVDYVYNDHMCT